MNLFGLEIRRAGLSPVSSQGGWWPTVREPYTGAWQRNVEWTTETVQAHHAVYACITRIAQDIGKLRPKLVERDKNGIWSEVENTAHSPALRRPNRFQNHIQFKESWAISKLTHGNTYVLIERDNREVPSAFYVLDPSRVTVLVAPDGGVFYELKTDNLAGLQDDQIAVPASEIIHDRMNCLYHPLVGTSPIFACGVAANMGLKIAENSSAFFANGSNPSGILSSVATIDKEKSLELSDIWNARFGGSRSGGVAVIGGGMTYTAMRMNAVDSQTIEQLKWTAETVCSTFHVPPWKVGIGEQPAYTKPELSNHAYYSDCLQSHIEQWELCMDEAFGFQTTTEGRWLGVELDLDGLLRMDAASQVETIGAAVKGSLYTVNEARKKLDQPPVSGGDSIWMQQQNYSLEALAERDKNDPFAPAPAPQLPAPEPQKALPAGEPEARAVDETAGWDGLFARDALALVREAQAVVADSIAAQERAANDLFTRASLERMSRSVQALAERETVIHVAAPVVTVEPAQVHVATPDVHVAVTMQPEAGKTVTRSSKVVRDEVGAIVSVDTTETRD